VQARKDFENLVKFAESENHREGDRNLLQFLQNLVVVTTLAHKDEGRLEGEEFLVPSLHIFRQLNLDRFYEGRVFEQFELIRLRVPILDDQYSFANGHHGTGANMIRGVLNPETQGGSAESRHRDYS
jgi:hypothetical protein